jgi:ABC-type branched-subunit amino acid transport system substrate-binding protein
MIHQYLQRSRSAGDRRRGAAPGGTSRLKGARIPFAAASAAAAISLLAVASPATANVTAKSGSGATLTVADVAPFTGIDAALGPTYLVSCDGATNAINNAGGVLGHQFKCKAVDTRGDPADAVPAVRQMYASTSNLALVIGLTSDEAASVVPIINSNKTVMFGMTGQSEFDHTHFPYFYRLVPPDLAESYAMVAIAKYDYHYKRVALAFGNDIGSQTFVTPAIQSLKKAGLKLVDNETLDLSATTFRTEASKIIASHPDVIFTEALGPTEAAFLTELKQQNGGKVIPVIGTSATISPDWYKSVSAAVGASTLSSNYAADNLVVETSGPAYQGFAKAILAEKGKVGNTGNFSTYLSAPGAVHLYDGINLAALAMIEAKSTSPSVYRNFITKIGDGVPGAVVVHTFAAGAAALKAGKQIRYEGPGGPTNFDSYHDSTGIFQIDKYGSSGQVVVSGNIPSTQLRAVS